MLTRRLIRIKVFQELYAHLQSKNTSTQSSLNYLKKSLTGIRDTFNLVVTFPIELFHYVKIHFNPSDRYLNNESNGKQFELLTANRPLEILKQHEDIRDSMAKPRYNWFLDSDFLAIIYKKIVASEKFARFVSTDSTGFKEQQEFLLWLYEFLMRESEDFDLKMEDLELHWGDEKYALFQGIKKTVESLHEDAKPEEIEIPVLSRDIEDDLEFARTLLNTCISKATEYEDLIASKTPGWESERIARPDLILMIMAICEFLEFPQIPVKVTINEYLELAKLYSTPQSSKFINGILDRLLKDMTEAKLIVKKGRGLTG
jgi:N utilization substance protein B